MFEVFLDLQKEKGGGVTGLLWYIVYLYFVHKK
jgi:hypothetical protein